MGHNDRWRAFVGRKLKDQTFQERSFVAFKGAKAPLGPGDGDADVSRSVGLSVSLGTLLSLTPGYANLWNNPVSLADQVIFTILGGANLTVGGATEQFFWRFVVGAVVGTAGYSALNAVGGAPVAQGILFFIFVYILTLVRDKVPRSNTGLQFAILACVYAVDYSYRQGNVYKVDTAGLKDLLRAWAFGTAISLAVNFFALPVKASRLARDRTAKALDSIRDITRWLLLEQVQTGGRDGYTPASVRKVLNGHGDTLSRLQSELAWEFGWSASTLQQREEILGAILAIQGDLVVGARNGPFVSDLPEDLVGMIRPAVELFAERALEALNSVVACHQSRRSRKADIERDSAAESSIKDDHVFEKAAADITGQVVSALRSDMATQERLESLDRATHCLDTMIILAADITRLRRLVRLEASRQRGLQGYVLHTMAANIRASLTWPFSRSRETGTPARALASFVPRVPLSHRMVNLITSRGSRYAFKVAAALSCLLAILWAPTSREFFLNYAVRNSTVPLLLALMPTLGLSVLSWAGQLGGAALGVLYAGLIMLIWRGIGRQAYCVPGLFFVEWFLCLGVGWRMLNGPDFLAVTSMNACAIFINVQWQLTGTPGEPSLGLHLGYMLTTASIAIAFAIPFQLMLFPIHARDELRNATAQTLRRLARLALEEVELSSAVLFSEDKAMISSEANRLAGEVADIKGSLRAQDGLVDMAAAEWGSHDGFRANRARELVEVLHRCADTIAAHIGLCGAGPIDPRIRGLLGRHNESTAHAFAQACSTAFWCLGASWTLFESPPAPLPSVDDAGEALLRQIRQPPPGSPPEFNRSWVDTDPAALGDVRRLWSLTLTLVTQRSEIEAVMRIMGPDWDKPGKVEKRPAATWRVTGLSEDDEKIAGGVVTLDRTD